MSAKRGTASLVFFAVLSACDSTSPEERVPRIGRYSYSSRIENGIGWSARNYGGTMTVTSATSSQLIVTWQVAGFRVGPDSGSWNENAYRVEGDPETFGTIAHRVTRSSSGLACSGSIYGVGPTGLVSQPVVCTMTYQGP